MRELKCPICKKKTHWEKNANRPFCSERCKLIDLGKWADGSYSLEGPPAPEALDLGDEPPEYLN
ncbi:MAG: DNA gyrase inhibitor YacG [bacterium]|nr:DNA gyrase inhibitor YacG [bacterium]